jgi:hypothetical protein
MRIGACPALAAVAILAASAPARAEDTRTGGDARAATDPMPIAPVPRHFASWIVGGSGAAFVAAGVIAGLTANSVYGTLKSTCSPDGVCNNAAFPSGAQTQIDNGKSAAQVTDVTLAVGITAVIVGGILWLVEGRDRHEQRHAWRIAPTPGGGLALEITP